MTALKKSLSPANYFEQNRYVYLTGVLSKEICDGLTKRMFALCEEGKLVKDEQCPLSDSVYGDPELDNLLGKLAKPLSEQLGVELLPTYTYARIYRPGEVLARHIDRESCEISGTMTLGFDPESEIWPIYFSHDPQDTNGFQINIKTGDLVMYRGNELTHWRPAYRGRWQVQVFFHYVDANGPHKDWAFDKRGELGTTAENRKVEKPSITERVMGKPEVQQPNVHELKVTPKAIYNGVMIPALEEDAPMQISFHSNWKPQLAFTKEECQAIIDLAKSKYPEKARVGADSEGKVDTNVRRVDQYGLSLNDKTKWIFDRLAAATSIANHEYYKYEIMGITHELQLLHYKSDEQSFYKWHTDIGKDSAATRKISVVAMLSDPNDYEGGELIVNNYGVEIPANKEQGAVNMFPSFLLHTVTPVTKGERWVLVIWVHGSQRFK